MNKVSLHRRQFFWTTHMLGIVVAVADKGAHEPTNFAPYALIRLAQEGYVRVGKRVVLTEAGREVVSKCEEELHARSANRRLATDRVGSS